MDIVDILKYVLAVVSVLIIVVVLLQTRMGGIGSVFGGSSGSDDLYKSKRGFEGFLYYSTMVLAILFAVVSIAISYLSV